MRRNWTIGFALFGLIAPLASILLLRMHVKLSPYAVATVWPTLIVVITGLFGLRKGGVPLYGVSVLLNVLAYGVTGWLSALWLEKWRRKHPPDKPASEMNTPTSTTS